MNYIEAQLNKLGYGNNLGNMLTADGSIMDVMRLESKRLEDLLLNNILNYYFSYYPKVYVRTYDLLDSVRVSLPIIVDGTITFEVYFDDIKANHPSLWKDRGGQDGYVPILLDFGYSWKNPRISTDPMGDHFSHYTGFHFVKTTLDEYNLSNPYGIHVEAFYNGQPYEVGASGAALWQMG